MTESRASLTSSEPYNTRPIITRLQLVAAFRNMRADDIRQDILRTFASVVCRTWSCIVSADDVELYTVNTVHDVVSTVRRASQPHHIIDGHLWSWSKIHVYRQSRVRATRCRRTAWTGRLAQLRPLYDVQRNDWLLSSMM